MRCRTGLEYHGRWSIDMDSVDEAWSDEIRAVVVVSPNNPTGSGCRPGRVEGTRGALRLLRRLALILAEVFADYPLEGASRAPVVMPLGPPPGSAAVQVRRSAAGQAGMDGARWPGPNGHGAGSWSCSS